ALLLAAVALYLKSIFPGTSRADEQSPDDRPEDEQAGEAMLAAAEVSGGDADHPAAPVQEFGQAGSGTQPGLFDLPRLVNFTLVESPAFQFIEPKPRLDWFTPRTTSIQPTAANDNPGGGASGGAGGGSAGGGGGGGLPGGGTSPPGDGPPKGDGETPDPGGGNEPGTGSGPGAGNDPDEPGLEDPGQDDEDTNRAPRLSGPIYLM